MSQQQPHDRVGITTTLIFQGLAVGEIHFSFLIVKDLNGMVNDLDLISPTTA